MSKTKRKIKQHITAPSIFIMPYASRFIMKPHLIFMYFCATQHVHAYSAASTQFHLIKLMITLRHSNKQTINLAATIYGTLQNSDLISKKVKPDRLLLVKIDPSCKK